MGARDAGRRTRFGESRLLTGGGRRCARIASCTRDRARSESPAETSRPRAAPELDSSPLSSPSIAPHTPFVATPEKPREGDAIAALDGYGNREPHASHDPYDHPARDRLHQRASCARRCCDGRHIARFRSTARGCNPRCARDAPSGGRALARRAPESRRGLVFVRVSRGERRLSRRGLVAGRSGRVSRARVWARRAPAVRSLRDRADPTNGHLPPRCRMQSFGARRLPPHLARRVQPMSQHRRSELHALKRTTVRSASV